MCVCANLASWRNRFQEQNLSQKKKKIKNHVEGSREMAQPLGALANLVEGWSSAPSVQ